MQSFNYILLDNCQSLRDFPQTLPNLCSSHKHGTWKIVDLYNSCSHLFSEPIFIGCLLYIEEYQMLKRTKVPCSWNIHSIKCIWEMISSLQRDICRLWDCMCWECRSSEQWPGQRGFTEILFVWVWEGISLWGKALQWEETLSPQIKCQCQGSRMETPGAEAKEELEPARGVCVGLWPLYIICFFLGGSCGWVLSWKETWSDSNFASVDKPKIH